jgi:hypothetical protein
VAIGAFRIGMGPLRAVQSTFLLACYFVFWEDSTITIYNSTIQFLLKGVATQGAIKRGFRLFDANCDNIAQSDNQPKGGQPASMAVNTSRLAAGFPDIFQGYLWRVRPKNAHLPAGAEWQVEGWRD